MIKNEYLKDSNWDRYELGWLGIVSECSENKLYKDNVAAPLNRSRPVRHAVPLSKIIFETFFSSNI